MPESKAVPRPPPLPAYILRFHSAQISTISFSNDNERLYSGDSSGSVVTTSTRTLRSVASWKAHTDGLLGVQEWDISVITHGRDNKLHVWERLLVPLSVGSSAASPDLPVPVLRYSLDVNALNFCRFSLISWPGPAWSDGQSALIAVPNLVESSLVDIWSLPARQRLHAAIGKCGRTESDLQADGRGGEKTGILMAIHLFDTEHPSAPDRRDLRVLAAYESGGVTLWRNTQTERETSVEGRGWEAVWSVKQHIESVMALALSKDKKLALSVSADHLVVRYDLVKAEQTGVERNICFTAHKIKNAGNGAIAIQDDGRVCAIGGWDGKIRLFSTKTMKALGTLSHHTGGCYAVAFARQATDAGGGPDDDDDDMLPEEKIARSRWVAAGGQDRRLSLWGLMDFGKA